MVTFNILKEKYDRHTDDLESELQWRLVGYCSKKVIFYIFVSSIHTAMAVLDDTCIKNVDRRGFVLFCLSIALLILLYCTFERVCVFVSGNNKIISQVYWLYYWDKCVCLLLQVSGWKPVQYCAKGTVCFQISTAGVSLFFSAPSVSLCRLVWWAYASLISFQRPEQQQDQLSDKLIVR